MEPLAKIGDRVVDEAFVVRMLDFQPLAGRNLGDRLWQILEAGGIQDGEQIPALLGALQHALSSEKVIGACLADNEAFVRSLCRVQNFGATDACAMERTRVALQEAAGVKVFATSGADADGAFR